MPTRAVWLEACFSSPEQTWDRLLPLAGSQARRAPSSAAALAAQLTGLGADQIEQSVDLERPVTVLLFDPEQGDASEAVAVIVSRNSSGNASHGVDRRELEREGEQNLYLHAEGERIVLATSRWALEQGRAHDRCDAEAGGAQDVTLEITEALLRSAELRRSVERRGASLEASAREASARQGRSPLGDPETVARMISAWALSTLEDTQGAAPIRASVTLRSDGARVDVEASPNASERREDAQSAAPILSLVAPDAYFLYATRHGDEARAEDALALVGGLARSAGDRLSTEERRELEAAAGDLAQAQSGWSAFALRPGHEPGPLVAVAAADVSSPDRATAAMARLAPLATRGYLHELLDHLGVAVTVDQEQHHEGQGGVVRFTAATPSWATEEEQEPSAVRTLTGAAPALSYRIVDGPRLLVAFGQDPEQELARMDEAATAGASVTSVLTQPVVETVAAAPFFADTILFGWSRAMASLPSRGSPRAGGLPSGGAAVAFGSQDGRWRATLSVTAEEVELLVGVMLEQ